MTQERWKETLDKITDSFEVQEQSSTSDQGFICEWVVFTVPGKGKLKLEWHDDPKQIGEIGLSAKRIGAHSTIQKQYSQEERTQYIALFSWNPGKGDWDEIDASAFS